MDRRSLEAIVEILAVRRRAVNQCGAGDIEAARMPQQRALPLAVKRCDYGRDVVLARGGDHETGDVEHHGTGHIANLRRDVIHREPGRPGGEQFRAGDVTGVVGSGHATPRSLLPPTYQHNSVSRTRPDWNFACAILYPIHNQSIGRAGGTSPGAAIDKEVGHVDP